MLLNRRILFVGGKGGVGKTTTAGALALRFADRGDRVLLVSTDPAHSLSDLFEVGIGGRVRELAPRLQGLEIDPDAQVESYLAGVRRSLRSFVRADLYPEIDRQIALARHAPGAVEAALLERVAELMDGAGTDYDRLVFDTAPTGHTLRLLVLPEMMQAWTERLLRRRTRSASFGSALERLAGRKRDAPGDAPANAPVDAPVDARAGMVRDILVERRRKFDRARRLLLDGDATGFLLVLVPERLALLESRKALDTLRGHGIPLVGMVVNGVLPREGDGDFLEQRRAQQDLYLRRIERELGDLPRAEVPLLPRDVAGIEGLRQIARYLEPDAS
jgi:arsenite/tail-anchored protein-transporting ATPase